MHHTVSSAHAHPKVAAFDEVEARHVRTICCQSVTLIVWYEQKAYRAGLGDAGGGIKATTPRIQVVAEYSNARRLTTRHRSLLQVIVPLAHRLAGSHTTGFLFQTTEPDYSQQLVDFQPDGLSIGQAHPDTVDVVVTGDE